MNPIEIVFIGVLSSGGKKIAVFKTELKLKPSQCLSPRNNLFWDNAYNVWCLIT